MKNKRKALLARYQDGPYQTKRRKALTRAYKSLETAKASKTTRIVWCSTTITLPATSGTGEEE